MSEGAGPRLARTAIGFAIAFALVSVVVNSRTPPPGFPAPAPIPEWVPAFLAMMALIGVGAWLVMPLVKAWAKRIEGRNVDSATHEEMAELRDRMTELDLTNARIHDLEERVDFAERMLAQRFDAPQLPMHRTPV